MSLTGVQEKDVYVEKYSSMHFAVFENPEMFWLEKEHSPKEILANDCKFYDAETTKRFQTTMLTYSEIFEKLKRMSKKVLL